MKKMILLLASALSLQAATVSTTIPVGGFTNALPGFNGYARVTQFVLSAPTATNAAINVLDVSTNTLVITNAAYTNTISYATNYTQIYTNFYGVITTNIMTNVLVDITNNVVAAATNNAPVKISAAVLAGTSFRMDNASYYFNQGIWVTNTGSGTAVVTITYQQ